MSNMDAVLSSIWAKTDMARPDAERWLSLSCHLADTRETASLLWDAWTPDVVRTALAADLGGADAARTAFRFLAAVHDVGKATPAFAVMKRGDPVYGSLVDRMEDLGLTIHPRLRVDDETRRSFRHELVGYAALRDWLTAHGTDELTASTWAAVVGGHHGNGMSKAGERRIRRMPARYCGDKTWHDARTALLDRASKDTGFVVPTHPLTRRAQILLTGLVIMADWIASDQSMFPLTGNMPADPAERAREAWKTLALPAPWRPKPVTDPTGLFHDRFGFEPRPFQQAAMDEAMRMSQPGVMILEAPMGEGKTEAALACAEILANRFGCGGAYTALPTRATADAMLPRILQWINHQPANGRPTAASVFLAHGHNTFNNDYTGLPWSTSNTREDDDDPNRHATLEAIAASWLRGRKHGLLAEFVVGTIDQCLALALKTRHLMLRHLAFAGKVIILDEIHACDAFMNEYLERALEWLGLLGCPVILMSATLTPDRRHALLTAYARGHNDPTPTMPDHRVATPLITTRDRMLAPRPSGRTATVTVRVSDGDMTGTIMLARQAVRSGGRLMIVRDTVRRAVATMDALDAANIPVTLSHSRYTAADRATHDKAVLDALAGDGPAVVVGTQTLEQSLDVDCDLMITDIAPTDLLLQRMGRLHRHDRPRPTVFATPTLIVDGVTGDGFDPSISRVYHPWTLMRTLDALHLDRPGDTATVRLPDDLPRLVADAYRTDGVPVRAGETDALESWLDRIDRSKTRAHGMFMLPCPGMSGSPRMEDWFTVGRDMTGGDGDPRGVRDGADSISLVLLERHNGMLVPYGDDTPLPLDPMEVSRGERIRVESRTITITPWMTAGLGLRRFTDFVDAMAPVEWRRLAARGPLAGLSALVLEEGRARVGDAYVGYDSSKGWMSE